MDLGNSDRWAAAFLSREPAYGEFDWLDTYAMVFSRCKPELAPEQAAQAASEAYVSQSWCNPKVAASADAVFGPVCGPSIHKAKL